jgi:hypothetical protein
VRTKLDAPDTIRMAVTTRVRSNLTIPPAATEVAKIGDKATARWLLSDR